jgi:hypothetical protein
MLIVHEEKQKLNANAKSCWVEGGNLKIPQRVKAAAGRHKVLNEFGCNTKRNEHEAIDNLLAVTGLHLIRKNR